MSQPIQGTPVSSRLRGKPRKNHTEVGGSSNLGATNVRRKGTKGTNVKRKGSTASKTTGKMAAGTKHTDDTKVEEVTDCPGISEELKPLAKYLESLQKASQKTLITTMVESIASCKSEIKDNLNEMIDSLKKSVEDIKGSFHKLEKSVEAKIGNIQRKVDEIESKADEAIQEVKELKQRQQCRDAESDQAREKIKAMETEIHDLREFKAKVEAQLVGLRGDIDRRMDEQDANIKFQKEKFDKASAAMENDMDAVKIRSYGNLNQIRHLSEQVEDIDNKQRSNNLIIEGLPEKADDETKTELVGIISKEIRDFQPSTMHTILCKVP